MNPLTVGLTHGIPSDENCPQTAGASRPATTALARNVVAFDAFGTAYANVPFALAATVAIRFASARQDRDPRRTPAPAWVTLPERRLTPLTFSPRA